MDSPNSRIGIPAKIFSVSARFMNCSSASARVVWQETVIEYKHLDSRALGPGDAGPGWKG